MQNGEIKIRSYLFANAATCLAKMFPGFLVNNLSSRETLPITQISYTVLMFGLPSSGQQTLLVGNRKLPSNNLLITIKEWHQNQIKIRYLIVTIYKYMD